MKKILLILSGLLLVSSGVFFSPQLAQTNIPVVHQVAQVVAKAEGKLMGADSTNRVPETGWRQNGTASVLNSALTSANPYADNTQDLGSASKRWRNIYSSGSENFPTSSFPDTSIAFSNNGTLTGSTSLVYSSGKVGIGTSAPTHALTLDATSSATGIALYNTADQTTNYERGIMNWASNVFEIGKESAGTAAARSVRLFSSNGANNRQSRLTITNASSPVFKFAESGTWGPGTATYVQVGDGTGTFNSATGVQTVFSVAPTFAQTAGTGYTALSVMPTETTVGTGTKYLADFGTSTADLVSINNVGQIIQHSGASSQGMSIYNTSDETTNYERGLLNWTSNQLRLRTDIGAAGTSRAIQIEAYTANNANKAFIYLNRGSVPFMQFQSDSTSATNATQGFSDVVAGSMGASSGSQILQSLRSTIAQTSTAGYTMLLVNATETTAGSGAKNLMDLQLGGVSKFSISDTGTTTQASASGFAGQAMCYATGGVFGHCTSVVGVGGACTCVAN